MAPCNRIEELDNNMGREMRKLRKPAIEKMRRDRINSSIEQLRLLLEKEIEKHELPTKPEKADILEMTVNFLRKQLHKATKAMSPSKPAFPSSPNKATIPPNNKYTATQKDCWSDPKKLNSTKDNVYHSLATLNQGIKQAVQACSAADLWRPW